MTVQSLRIPVLLAALLLPLTQARADEHWRVDGGALTLEVRVSETAHLFHVVDQISQWSEFCHGQYVTYFEDLDGGLSQEDRDLLAEHATIRGRHGWGGGLEQTFYTPLALDPALDEGVRQNHLTQADADMERRILERFRPRVEQLMAREAPTLKGLGAELSSNPDRLRGFADEVSRFVDCASLNVPVYLLANPSKHSGGGGYNGGRLTIEVPREYDPYPLLFHELFHAFLKTRDANLTAAAESVPGLNLETLSEGIAYAYSPGLRHAGSGDPLVTTAAEYLSKESWLTESYPRFNVYGLALRPILKQAFEEPPRTLDAFLPRAIDAWRVLSELEKARTGGAGGAAHDYKTDPTHSIFLFGIQDEEGWDKLFRTAGCHLFGRNHDGAAYGEMLDQNAKSGDTIILLLSLDRSERVPGDYGDLMPSPWPEVESRLKLGETVLLRGWAREMKVFLLAAPTGDALRALFRHCVDEGRFVQEQGKE